MEGNSLRFYIPMRNVPTCTHQEKKVTIVKGKPVFYEPADLKTARAKLRDHIGKFVPTEKLRGPLKLSVQWRFFSDKHPEGDFRVTKPDLDNLQKLLKDVMTDLGFWTDDAQVCQELTEKVWSREHPGLLIEIEKLEVKI